MQWKEENLLSFLFCCSNKMDRYFGPLCSNYTNLLFYPLNSSAPEQKREERKEGEKSKEGEGKGGKKPKRRLCDATTTIITTIRYTN